jgi:hypothetical protein
MALFSFRTRNPQRDRETDLGRLGQLLGLLRRLQAEIEAEKSGLQARYRQAQDSAAFALEAFENGDGTDLSGKADELALSMRRYQARIAALEKQAAFIRNAETEATTFYDTLKSAAEEMAKAG